jgi:hypothetical protein
MSARDPLARPLRAVPACLRVCARATVAARVPIGRPPARPAGGALALLAGRGLDRVVVRVLMAASRIGTTPTPERTTKPPASSDGRAMAESLRTGRRINLERERPTRHPRSLARRAGLDPRALVLLAAGRASAAPRRGLSLALARHSKPAQTRCTGQQSHSDCCVRDTADERPRERRTRGARSRVWTLSDLGIDRHPSSERSARLRRRSRAWPAPIQFVGRFCTLRVNNNMNGHGQRGRAGRLLQRLRLSAVPGMLPGELRAAPGLQRRSGGSGAPGRVPAGHGTAGRVL